MLELTHLQVLISAELSLISIARRRLLHPHYEKNLPSIGQQFEYY
jgi:hypothetical protein